MKRKSQWFMNCIVSEELLERVEKYRKRQRIIPNRSAVTRVALEEFLAREDEKDGNV